MKRTHTLNPLIERYHFDFNECTPAKGWAQIDTGQDASYFGAWTNPATLQIVQFTEGDITRTQCVNQAQYCAELRSMKSWNDQQGWGMKIDGMCRVEIVEQFRALGLADLLH